uniref:Stigma-specific STIG1-like protein 1 n=1 Tax=Panagrellus redivivus TaxID=6233 RepID=A0A7E4ZT51_PANRE
MPLHNALFACFFPHLTERVVDKEHRRRNSCHKARRNFGSLRRHRLRTNPPPHFRINKVRKDFLWRFGPSQSVACNKSGDGGSLHQIMRTSTFVLVCVVIAAVTVPTEAAKKYCGPSLKKMTALTCTFSGESRPCLKTSGSTTSAADKCCKSGCDLTYIKNNLCCFSQSCLDSCYPGKNYKVGTVY